MKHRMLRERQGREEEDNDDMARYPNGKGVVKPQPQSQILTLNILSKQILFSYKLTQARALILSP